jgi:lipoyl(octanoyl) transferase
VIPWRWLGEVEHGAAVAQQEAARAAILAGDGDAQVVFLASHPPTITLGHRADRANVLVDPAAAAAAGVAIVATSRGGDVTYHGPGQLMIYPVVRVRSVVGYLAAVAEEIVAAAAACGVPGARFERDPAGVWLGDAKLAACGLHLARGVAIHGWAWNVATPPSAWDMIVPCGLRTPVVSLAEAAAARGALPPPPVAELAERLGPAVAARLSAAVV